LQTMRPIRDPPACPFDILPRRDRGYRPHHGHELPMATDFNAQDAKARLFAMKGHTLDCTSEVFRRMGTGWCLCKSIHRVTTLFLGCASTLALARDDDPRRRSSRSWREAYDTPEQ